MTSTDAAPPRADEPNVKKTIRQYQPMASTTALSIRADWLRTDTDLLREDVRNFHGQTRTRDLYQRAHDKATASSVATLLEELAFVRGMSWTDIAAAADVSISAVRKWRNGGDAAPENRTRLALVASLLDLLEDKGVVDPAQWMEMALPLPHGYHIRPMDLFIDRHAEALIELVEQRSNAMEILDEIIPDWRDQRSDIEVFEDTDGQRSLRLRME